ncbi:MAG: UDP-glucose 4-epimerase GalE [Pseudomonadota bacterium]
MACILVTGGAGYIGSHTVKLLGRDNENVVVLDNLYSGFAESITHGTFVQGDTGDRALLDRVLEEHDIETVLHFAAHTIVPESVENPLKYYGNNTANTRTLLEACNAHGVKHFVFSSTAATYGEPASGRCNEETPAAPINPYGMSKLMSETMLRDLNSVSDMNHVILRYFNVAGSDPDGVIGQSTEKATLLIKVAAEHVVGKRDAVYIFGTDYATADGTGIRDYIHVSDLAEAHVSALRYLRGGGSSVTLNCGYGSGFSVRDVLNTVQSQVNHELNIIEKPRRAGDPPELVADVDLIHDTLDWTPRFNDLDTIVRTSIEWERRLLQDDFRRRA